MTAGSDQHPLNLAGILQLALEAKKEAKHFEVPPGATLVRKIESLLKCSKDFTAAVRQVIPYCAIEGAQIAVVCNGPQLAIFQAIIPGQSPLSGECYFFDGFQSYIDNFPILWKLLSPEGITENCAYRDLALYRNPRLPPKLSVSIPEPFKYRYRSKFQENLRSLSSVLLEEIEDNPEIRSDFYRECYIPIEANNRHLLLSKNIIAARYRRVSDDGIAPSAMDEITVLDRDGNVHINDPGISSVAGSRPIVVVGDVGVGKTSFFENLFLGLSGDDKANTYFIHLNLGAKATLTSDIKSYVLSEVPSVLKNKYGLDINSAEFAKTIYYRELLDFDRSVKGALKDIDLNAYKKERIDFLSSKISRRDAHLQSALGHLAHGRKKQVILVLDNADQRSFAVQQETFLIAQEFAATRNMLVFVALRPSTFYLSKTSGSLAAYQNKLLTISPPPADEVVQKRILFAIRVAQGEVSPAALPGITLNLKSVVLFLRATSRSIRTNDSIRQFLSNISGGNTRSVVELVTGFFGSPNVDSEKIVELEEGHGNYKIPLHEFTKHALLGEYAYFNSHSSVVACNIFDVSAADPREHFLASLIVAYLSSNIGSFDNDGFLKGQLVLTEMARHGFVEDQSRSALQLLARKRLIETPYAHFREIPVDDAEKPEQFYFRATSVGIYHVKYWSGSFAFLDAVSTDTPIFDEQTRDEISARAASFLIADRYRKTVSFSKYLETQWHLSNFGASYYDFPSLIKSQADSFEAVKRVVDRAMGRVRPGNHTTR
jgi:GTPase SAR1 family protein